MVVLMGFLCRNICRLSAKFHSLLRSICQRVSDRSSDCFLHEYLYTLQTVFHSLLVHFYVM